MNKNIIVPRITTRVGRVQLQFCVTGRFSQFSVGGKLKAKAN